MRERKRKVDFLVGRSAFGETNGLLDVVDQDKVPVPSHLQAMSCINTVGNCMSHVILSEKCFGTDLTKKLKPFKDTRSTHDTISAYFVKK